MASLLKFLGLMCVLFEVHAIILLIFLFLNGSDTHIHLTLRRLRNAHEISSRLTLRYHIINNSALQFATSSL